MKEVKSPKKPLLYYYGIVLLIIFAFNLLVAPMLTQSRVTEVDYGTFMDMIDQGDIGIVQVEDSQIVFTDKDEVLGIVEKAILLFREQGLTGERFADTVERIGFENVQEQLLSDGLLQRKEENLKLNVKGGATC